MFFMFLTHMLNFMPIRDYLVYDSSTYFLCIILYFKNLQFKQLTDNKVTNLWSSRNFANMKKKKKCNLMVDLSKNKV